MLTAELKINGKVIGTFEARRTLYENPATGLPMYNCDAWVDNPRAAGKIGRSRLVEDHNPATDDAWDLVRRALSWKADADLAEARRERDEARATVERVQTALSNHPRCDIHPDDDPITCGWKRAVADVQAALDGEHQ